MLANRPRPLLLAVWPVLVVAALSACDGDPGFTPAPDHELLTQVQDEEYRAWSRVPGREMRQATQAPHGGLVDIFINEPVAEAVANEDGLGRTAWPEGSIIVLEGYADEVTTTLSQLAIMQKRHGVWYWEQYQGDDFERPRFSGRPDVCLGCHNTGQDFTRSFPLPKMVMN